MRGCLVTESLFDRAARLNDENNSLQCDQVRTPDDTSSIYPTRFFESGPLQVELQRHHGPWGDVIDIACSFANYDPIDNKVVQWLGSRPKIRNMIKEENKHMSSGCEISVMQSFAELEHLGR